MNSNIKWNNDKMNVVLSLFATIIENDQMVKAMQ
jgi:hypothetical protein